MHGFDESKNKVSLRKVKTIDSTISKQDILERISKYSVMGKLEITEIGKTI